MFFLSHINLFKKVQVQIVLLLYFKPDVNVADNNNKNPAQQYSPAQSIEDEDDAQHNQTASTFPIEDLLNCDKGTGNVNFNAPTNNDVNSFSKQPSHGLADNKNFVNCNKLSNALSDTETVYLDVFKSPEHGGSVTDYESMLKEVNDSNPAPIMIDECQTVIKRKFNIVRRSFKIRIKAHSSGDCDIKGNPTQTGIRICISPRTGNENSVFVGAQQENVNVTSTTVTSSEAETDYEFRNAIKSELKRSPSAAKVLRYLESLSEAKKVSPEDKKKRKSKRSQETFLKPVSEVNEYPLIPISDWTPEKPNEAIPVQPTVEPATESTSKVVLEIPIKAVNEEKSVDLAHAPENIYPQLDTAELKLGDASTEKVEGDTEVFHDACDKNSSLDSTDSSGISHYEDTTEFLDTSYDQPSSSNQGSTHPEVINDKPLLTITQEMSSNMDVTSKVEVNRSKMKKRRSHSSGKKKKNSPEKIISDNFCNEVLDQAMKKAKEYRRSLEKGRNTEQTKICPNENVHSRRSGEKHVQLPVISSTDLSDSDKPCGPQKPPRTFSYSGPKARRSCSQDRNNNCSIQEDSSDQSLSNLSPLDLNLYDDVKQKLITFNRRSLEMIKAKAQKNDRDTYNQYIGWTSPEKDTNQNFNNQNGENEVVLKKRTTRITPGWAPQLPPIPPKNLLNMLQYSDDERKRAGIVTNHVRAERQYM